MKKRRDILVSIDQTGSFFPKSEGERLELDGYGELPVPGSEATIQPTNDLTAEFVTRDLPIVYANDEHHEGTAHISDNPNYDTTWCRHNMVGTPGAELHADLFIAQDPTLARKFIKGDEIAATPEDDKSYTAALAHDPLTGEVLPDYMQKNGITHITLVGLAIKRGRRGETLCVDSSALDLHDMGYKVTVVSDAVEAIIASDKDICARNLGAAGIRWATAAEVIAELEEIYNA